MEFSTFTKLVKALADLIQIAIQLLRIHVNKRGVCVYRRLSKYKEMKN